MSDGAAADASDMLGGPEGREAYRELVRNGDFRNLFFAMLTSSLGDWIGVLAILALTKSILGPTRAAAFALSGVMIARILPTLLLGPVAGVFVDRWNRKRTLIWTDIGRGVVMALIPFSNDVFQLFLATLVIETMSTLFIPAKDAVLPGLVRRERLVQANQLSLGVTYGTLPLGGALFAALVGIATTFLSDWGFLADRPSSLAIWFNAATFFLSAVFIARIASGPAMERDRPAGSVRGAAATSGAWQELKEGFRFIASQPLIRALVIGVMAAFLAAGVVISVGELFAGVVNAGSSGFGVLVAVVGTGLFVGLGLAAPASRRLDKEQLFGPGIGVAGVALIVTALMPRLDLAAIPAFVMGIGAGVAFITGYTLLQERSANEIRGRTFAAFNTGVRLALFVSLVVGPSLVGLIGPEGTELAADGPFTPYAIGGVRATLMLAGAIAFAGAVWSGRAIHGVLSRRSALRLNNGDALGAGAPQRGFFVAFEGGEGSGKSTQIRLLRAAIEREGHDAVTTREPGGTRIGERVRELLLDTGSEGLTDRAEALLYAAARAQHAEEIIRPALEKGAVVLCDRYVDSSVAYQGRARKLGEEQVEELNRWGTGELLPDLVVLLDIDAEEGLARAGSDPDRLEAAGLPFHRTVNQAYRHRAAADPARYLVLDAARPVEELHAAIRDEVLRRLAKQQGEVT